MGASKKSKIALAGASAIAVEPFLAMLPHSNGVSVVASIIIGGVIYNIVETIEEKTGRDLSLPVPKFQGNAKEPGQHGWGYRILNGKSTRGEESEDAFMQSLLNMPDVKEDESEPRLNLGESFNPYADTFLSKRIGMFGQPGSGKSNALTVFLEEIGRLDNIGVPFLLCDTEGEFGGLHSREYLTRPYRAGAHNISVKNAFTFGQMILEKGYQAVLDLLSYEDDNVAAMVMVEAIRGMRQWEEAHENDDRAACYVILDEATTWLPQQQGESMLSKQKGPDGLTVLQKLQNAFFGVVRKGRKRGLGFVFATQRPADLDNRAISCDWFFLFKQSHPSDLAVYKKIGVNEEEAKTLQPGQALVVDGLGNKTIQQFRFKRSKDNAKSPGIASLSRYKNQPESIYKEDQEINTETLVNEVVNTVVNGSQSEEKRLSEKGRLHLLPLDVNGNSEHEDPSMTTVNVNVNAETRDIIKRMNGEGIKHATIAKVVRLDGRKYPIYKAVCLEEGIKIEKEA